MTAAVDARDVFRIHRTAEGDAAALDRGERHLRQGDITAARAAIEIANVMSDLRTRP